MELIDFFSFNTVYLEMQELFDEYSIEKTAKSSINKSRKELLECYEDESDMITQVYMSSYFMSLQNGFCDEKSKNIFFVYFCLKDISSAKISICKLFSHLFA